MVVWLRGGGSWSSALLRTRPALRIWLCMSFAKSFPWHQWTCKCHRLVWATLRKLLNPRRGHGNPDPWQVGGKHSHRNPGLAEGTGSAGTLVGLSPRPGGSCAVFRWTVSGLHRTGGHPAGVRYRTGCFPAVGEKPTQLVTDVFCVFCVDCCCGMRAEEKFQFSPSEPLLTELRNTWSKAAQTGTQNHKLGNDFNTLFSITERTSWQKISEDTCKN